LRLFSAALFETIVHTSVRDGLLPFPLNGCWLAVPALLFIRVVIFLH